MPRCLVGGLAIATPAGAPVSLPTRKTGLVLAALAILDGKGATREALAEWIWPDRSEGQGKSSLRQALTAIRKALPAVLEGAALESEQDSIRLSTPAALADLRAFEALARSTLSADRLRAAAPYGADPLHAIGGAPCWERGGHEVYT